MSLFDNTFGKEMQEIANRAISEQAKSLYKVAKMYGNALQDGERLYIIYEASSPMPTETGIEASVNIVPLRTFDKHAVVEEQVAALMKGKMFSLYGPLSKAMIDGLR